ncbi:Hypothetical predicted protein, partial [Paramuricea clavata]
SLLGKPIYILGDANCNMLKPDSPNSSVFINFCSCFNLTQMTKSPTRVTRNSESLIDVILATNPNQVLETKVVHCSISDHDLVYAVLRPKKERPKPVYITTRSFKSYNASEFCADILQAPWSITDVFDDVEDKLHAFNSLFNDILDKHAPVKTIKPKGKPNCCVTEEIRELMKTRDEWKKTARKTNDPFAWYQYLYF